MLFHFLVLAVFTGVAASAAERPVWTTHTPADTSKTLFFVGRSAKVNSESEGLRMASKDAREQLLRQEFGTTIKVESNQRETLKDVGLDSRLSEISDTILLRGFKQNEIYSEKAGDQLEVWAIFEVSKAEIAGEKQRIEELQKQKAAQSFSGNAVTPAKEFDNGGKAKLRHGIRKSQVIESFGKPDIADSNSFTYRKRDFCDGAASNYCAVFFDDTGLVRHWHRFKGEFTTDLDDVETASEKKPTPDKTPRIRPEKTPRVWSVKTRDEETGRCASILQKMKPFTEFNNSMEMSVVACSMLITVGAEQKTYSKWILDHGEPRAFQKMLANSSDKLFEAAKGRIEPFKISGNPAILHFGPFPGYTTQRLNLMDSLNNRQVQITEADFVRLKKNFSSRRFLLDGVPIATENSK